MKRRDALKNTSFTAAFLGLNSLLHGQTTNLITGNTKPLYGSLIKDPNGLLDLPQGFSYQIISQFGDSMTDGLTVPGKFDGMAAFSTDKGNIILIRNHEIGIVPPHSHLGPFPDKSEIPPSLDRKKFYDIGDGKKNHLPHCGGTSTIVYNPKTAKTEKQYMSLIGTDRNCAGGAMPWGTWITAEEPEDTHSPRGQKHGYCFEVKATEEVELQAPKPLTQLGRFRHEAVALDPRTGILYLTEDRKNGLFYRFIPEVPKDFTKGKLQALALGKDSPDTRNYSREAPQFPLKTNFEATWIDLQDVDTPADDLRVRGHAQGAARFARAEGIIFSGDHFYIACTNGGPTRQGQIFKFTPGVSSSSDQLSLFVQPDKSDLMNNGDNICISPLNQHLFICEDLVKEHAHETPHLRIVTPQGQIHTFARNALNKSEFAGSCFSEDGQILFVNIQNPGHTLAITGPWTT